MRNGAPWADCFLNVSVEALSCVLLNSLNPLCTVEYTTSSLLLTHFRPREDYFCSPQAHSEAWLGTCRWCSLLKEMNLEEPLQGPGAAQTKGLFLLSLHRFWACLSGVYIETRLLQSDLNTQAQLPRLQAVLTSQDY